MEALRRIKVDAGARERFAAFNRTRVQDFSIERCASRYEEIFDEVIRSTPRA